MKGRDESTLISEEMRRLISCVGSRSGDHDLIGDPSDALNVDCYNSLDLQFRWFHLSLNLVTCLILDRVDLASTASTQDIPRDLHLMIHVTPRIRNQENKGNIVPHGEKVEHLSSI